MFAAHEILHNVRHHFDLKRFTFLLNLRRRGCRIEERNVKDREWLEKNDEAEMEHERQENIGGTRETEVDGEREEW